MAYKAPIWEDGKSPAISAENLNNLSQAAEGAQVLYGNSAPTSSTEGAVGQFYLVVVADSDGNYPLYQCVAIANGSYTWRDTRRIPDSITSMLGIPAPGTINRALNVLAHVGNLHVWERVQSGVTDYLTSTDRNAYPDQSAEGGEPEIPAHYTLADAVTVDVLSSAADYSAMVYVCDLNSIIINNNGSISTTSFSTLMGGGNSLTTAGNWTKFSTTKAYYITSNSSNVVFTDTIFTVSAETTLQYADGKYVLPGCRELIGHAKVEAIPPNTSITYLGQLGDGARIEVGSYVGTGTYGSSNPNSLTASFPIKIAIIGNYKSGSTDVSATAIFLPMGCNTTFNKHGYFFSDYDSAMQDQYKYSRISKDGKTLYWYDSRYAKDQLNVSTRIYFYVLIG